MTGIVTEIIENLKKLKDPDERISVFVWTETDIEEVMEREKSAHPILASLIGGPKFYKYALHAADQLYDLSWRSVLEAILSEAQYYKG